MRTSCAYVLSVAGFLAMVGAMIWVITMPVQEVRLLIRSLPDGFWIIGTAWGVGLSLREAARWIDPDFPW